MFYAGIILHGICYDFFFVTGQIFVDREAPPHLKSAVQGMITLATYGVGMFIGSWAAGEIVKRNTIAENQHLWQIIWAVPAILSAMVFVLFAFTFKDKVNHQEM